MGPPLKWNPPILSFTVERHGAAVLGSTRAERQYWSVDLVKRTATATTSGYKQLRPQAAPITKKDMERIAERVCEAVQDGPNSASEYVQTRIIEWRGPDRVLVKHAELIPATNKQTALGRRKRFRPVLKEKMRALGWNLVGVTPWMTFAKGDSTS
jgi:hypothetical protein